MLKWLSVLSLLLVLTGCTQPVPLPLVTGAAQDAAQDVTPWLLVHAPTEAIGPDGETLYLAEPEAWYEVVEVEGDWALARWELDPPENTVWIALDSRIEIVSFAAEPEGAVALPGEPGPLPVATATPAAAPSTFTPPPPATAAATPSAAPSFASMLARVRTASYTATYALRMSVPLFPANLTPVPGTPVTPSGWGRVSGTMTWHIQQPQRRFDTVFQEGAQNLDPRRVQPGLAPDAQGRAPTFYFRGTDAYACIVLPESRCDDIGAGVGVDLVPLVGRIGGTPLWVLPFAADVPEELLAEIFPADRAPTALPSQQILGQTAFCYALAADASAPRIEVCFSEQGVPVRLAVGEEGADGSWSLVATDVRPDVAAGVFNLPSTPRPRPTPPAAPSR